MLQLRNQELNDTILPCHRQDLRTTEQVNKLNAGGKSSNVRETAAVKEGDATQEGQGEGSAIKRSIPSQDESPR